MFPLIDARSVSQSGMGQLVDQPLAGPRTFDGVPAVVIAVYPVGHPENPLGQTLVDVQPQADLPMLRRVPVCLAHAHQETEPAAAQSARRQPYAAKARNRIEGSTRDLRPGTRVWVQFVGGERHEPVVVATMKPNEQGSRAFPAERQIVDRIASDGKSVVPTEVHPLDSAMGEYPRAVDVFNGTRVETTNTGSHYVQTSIDREPVFPGHNGIPKSPDPGGSYGVSTRGARRGHIGFTTGKHPENGDESLGRQFRQTLAAEDGTIRDSTKDSKKGSFIRRLASVVGRVWTSTRGSGNGSVYHEDRVGDYVALTPASGRAELHGEEEAVLDAPAVRLGGAGASDEMVLWPQLQQELAKLWAAIDGHVHTGVESGDSVSGPPQVPAPGLIGPFAAQWAIGALQCKASGVFAAQENPSAPEHQDDPDGEG